MNHSIITSSVEKLASINSLAKMFDQDSEVFRMPSEKILAEIIDIVRDIIFPYHYGDTPVYADTLKYYIGVRVDRLSRLIREQMHAKRQTASRRSLSTPCRNFVRFSPPT